VAAVAAEEEQEEEAEVPLPNQVEGVHPQSLAEEALPPNPAGEPLLPSLAEDQPHPDQEAQADLEDDHPPPSLLQTFLPEVEAQAAMDPEAVNRSLFPLDLPSLVGFLEVGLVDKFMGQEFMEVAIPAKDPGLSREEVFPLDIGLLFGVQE